MTPPEPEGWIEEEPVPPGPTPPGWARPTPLEAEATVPVETQIQAEPGIDVQASPDMADRFHRGRRFLVTTLVFGLLFVAGRILSEGSDVLFLAAILVPLYLLFLPFVLHRPKRFRRAQPGTLLDRLDWQARLMTAVTATLLILVLFTFFSNEVIPFAPLVEYAAFALLLFLLIRLGGRAIGVAPSIEALPPPSHRLHQQVVAPIDDAHYQRNLWLNYSFVEKGRGARALARRLDEILESNGIGADRRNQIVAPLLAFDEEGFGFGRRRRERRSRDRDRRAAVLDQTYTNLSQELEHYA